MLIFKTCKNVLSREHAFLTISQYPWSKKPANGAYNNEISIFVLN